MLPLARFIAPFGIVAGLAASSPAFALPVSYALTATCVSNVGFGPLAGAFACPSSTVTGLVRMPDAYVPGSTVDQDFGDGPLPTVLLRGVNESGGDFEFAFGEVKGFWGVTMPTVTGAPSWGRTGNAAMYHAGGGSISWSSEGRLPNSAWMLQLDNAVVTRVPTPSTTPLVLLALAGAVAVGSRRRRTAPAQRSAR